MQEWIFAMLVICVLLILRDMAKTIFSEKWISTKELVPYCEVHPQKKKVEAYAQAFQKLSDIFYGIPCRNEYLNAAQVEQIQTLAKEHLCIHCYRCTICWNEDMVTMSHASESMIRAWENGEENLIQENCMKWSALCSRSSAYREILAEIFQKEKQKLIWNNRMIENRYAVAQQLAETADILDALAEDIYDITEADQEFLDKLRKKFRKYRVWIQQAWIMNRKGGHHQLFMTMRTKNHSCISMLEITQAVSELCACAMTPAEDCRCIVNHENHMVHFVEDVSYQVLYEVARLTKQEEKVSGDNYACHQGKDGKFIMCLADGMGSGIEACTESETVVELLEQFLESGFTPETAVRMVNSALILNGKEGMFSTIDLCAIDLYTGIGYFLKAGAAATFILRDRLVETIQSETLAAGLVQKLDFETTSRKLYHGDYIIMMTDGVLDALPPEHQDEIMKTVLLGVKGKSPREIGKSILERVLEYSDYCVRDDMTILVTGIWKK